MTKDVTWQECNIHLEDEKTADNEDDDGNEDRDVGFSLFAPPEEDEFEIFTYDYSQQLPDTVVQLRGHAEINNSTGLSMWLGSEILCRYILNNPTLIQNQAVVELGSGLGLCGIICYYLGAKRVLLTDGDTSVLSNLRYNVRKNVPRNVSCDDNEGNAKQQAQQQEEEHEFQLSCPQHIWGKNIDTFLNQYGTSSVIIATDCVYITQSLEPLWQSVDRLLIKKSSDENDNHDHTTCKEGIFLYTNRCSSAAPIEMVLEMATKYGFTWTKIDASDLGEIEGDDVDYDEESDGIYLFRRT